MQLGIHNLKPKSRTQFAQAMAFILVLALVISNPNRVFHVIGEMVVPTAHAGGGGAGGGGDCQNCGGGGEGGGGGKAGEILMGIAAIIAPIAAAMAQVAAAKEKANADKYIAKVSADAAITQTKLQSETTKELAENQKRVAEQNTKATRELAQEQQRNSTQRLQMQLAALEQEREKASEERAEIRAIEEQRAQEQIAFAREQADQNLKLAKLTMFQQAVQNGLTPTATNSGNGLSTTAISSGRSGGAPASGGIQSQLASSGGGNPLALGVTNSTSGPKIDRNTTINGSGGRLGFKSTNRGFGQSLKPAAQGKGMLLLNANNRPTPAPKSASTSLLSSVRKDFSKGVRPKSSKLRGLLKPVIPSRFASKRLRGVSQSVLMRTGASRGLAKVMGKRRGMIGGSTRGVRQRIRGLGPQNSGLRDFTRAIDRKKATERSRHTGRRAPGSGRVSNGHGGVQQYNLGSSSRGRGSAYGLRRLGR